MKTLPLLTELSFDEKRPHAEPLLFDNSGRVLRFSLKPGQCVREHCAPHSPVHIVVLVGKGMFAGEDGHEHLLGVGELVVFEAGELHRVRALDEDLVFVAFLHKVEMVPLQNSRQDHASSAREDTYLTWHM